MLRIIASWGLCWGPPILGKYHLDPPMQSFYGTAEERPK